MAYNPIVAYQLDDSADNQKAQTAIKALGPWAYFETWVFYVKSEYSAKAARDLIWASGMRAGDRLFVAELGNAASWQGLTKECSDFIKGYWWK